jgi:hypothetical protein
LFSVKFCYDFGISFQFHFISHLTDKAFCFSTLGSLHALLLFSNQQNELELERSFNFHGCLVWLTFATSYIAIASLREFGLDNGNGKVDRVKYMLLCTLKVGALSPDLIRIFNERFNLLDVHHKGALHYSENCKNQFQQIKQNSKVMKKR